MGIPDGAPNAGRPANPPPHRLALLLILTVATASRAGSPPQSGRSPDPAVIEHEVSGLGTGENVVVNLVSGETLRGCIANIDQSSFGLSSNCASPYRVVSYARVSRVRKRRSLLPWLLAGVVVATVVVVVIVHQRPHHLVVH